MNGMAKRNGGTKLTLVLGGTGKTGRRVVSRLEERGFGYAVIGLIPRWLARGDLDFKRPRQAHPRPPSVCAPAAIPTRVAVNLASSLCALTY